MLNNEQFHLAISGQSGCGNSTVSRIVADRLDLKHINYTFRSIAKEDGLSFQAVCERAELSDDDDLRVDRTQVDMAGKGSSVLGSRLAIWMLKEADLKIYLTASLEVRARRILQREGSTLSQKTAETQARDERDHCRYKKLYDIDNTDYSNADLVINTNRFNVDQVVSIIETAAKLVLQAKSPSAK